jgi:hypothetical protein
MSSSAPCSTFAKHGDLILQASHAAIYLGSFFGGGFRPARTFGQAVQYLLFF